MLFYLNTSPLLTSFKDLQIGEDVYSRKYGLGQVYRLYNDEVIIWFSNLRKRFSVDDEEIRKIPDKYLKKPKIKVKININGENMSYEAYKKKCGLLKRQIREDKQKYILINQAMAILNVNKNVFYRKIQINNIETKKFGTSFMIHRDDLLKLVNSALKITSHVSGK